MLHDLALLDDRWNNEAKSPQLIEGARRWRRIEIVRGLLQVGEQRREEITVAFRVARPIGFRPDLEWALLVLRAQDEVRNVTRRNGEPWLLYRGATEGTVSCIAGSDFHIRLMARPRRRVS